MQIMHHSLLANSNLQMISNNQKCANRSNKSGKNDDDGDTCQANKNERGGGVENNKNNNNNDDADNELASFKVS